MCKWFSIVLHFYKMFFLRMCSRSINCYLQLFRILYTFVFTQLEPNKGNFEALQMSRSYVIAGRYYTIDHYLTWNSRKRSSCSRVSCVRFNAQLIFPVVGNPSSTVHTFFNNSIGHKKYSHCMQRCQFFG